MELLSSTDMDTGPVPVWMTQPKGPTLARVTHKLLGHV